MYVLFLLLRCYRVSEFIARIYTLLAQLVEFVVVVVVVVVVFVVVLVFFCLSCCYQVLGKRVNHLGM